jgi:hypothetical protein
MLKASETAQPIWNNRRAAQALTKQNLTEGLTALNQLFRTGTPPEPPLGGRFVGELVAFNIAPGLTELALAMASAWMPWKGKTFDDARQFGDNIFTRNSKWLARLFIPRYEDFKSDGPETYRAFTFRTYEATGLTDPEMVVLKIDYDLVGNPPLTIRRVLDELVQLGEGLYLGKAHVCWWWGRWQMVAYFTLARSAG